MKWSPIPRRSDFGRSVCTIDRFELLSKLMYITEQKSFSLTIHSDSRHKFLSEIQAKTFGFQTFWCSNHYCYQTKVICPKSELHSSNFSIPLYNTGCEFFLLIYFYKSKMLQARCKMSQKPDVSKPEIFGEFKIRVSQFFGHTGIHYVYTI